MGASSFIFSLEFSDSIFGVGDDREGRRILRAGNDTIAAIDSRRVRVGLCIGSDYTGIALLVLHQSNRCKGAARFRRFRLRCSDGC